MNKVLHYFLPILLLLLSVMNQAAEAQNTIQEKNTSKNKGTQILLAPAKSDGKWGFIDEKGTFVISATYTFVSDFKEGLASVKSGDLWGYIDQKGEIVIAPEYKNAYNFAEGLARVQIDNKWGYIDRKGQLAVEASFDTARDFADGLAAVRIDNQYGYIDQAGKYVIHPQFEEAFSFSKGMALTRSKGKSQYITKRNSYISPVAFDDAAYAFSENLAVVKEGKYYGYINTNGRYVIEPQFTYAEDFSEGVAVVLDSNGQYGYIDTKGDYLLMPGLEAAQHFSEGLAAVKFNGKWGYIDPLGQPKITYQFDDAEPFINGLAKVKFGSKYGFLHPNGSLAIAPTFDWAFDFEEGKAAVLKNNAYGYIDTLGATKIDFQFEAVGNFKKVIAQEEPSLKPIITYIKEQEVPIIEVPEYFLQASIQSETPILEYLVFVNNQLHDIKEVGHKGTLIRPMSNPSAFHRNVLTSIPLSDGINEIYIKAINKNGTTNSEVLEVLYQPSSEIERPDLYVLTIGVSQHEHEQYNLNFADDDANDIAYAFRKQQQLPQDKRLFDNIIVETLVDEQATTANIKRRILDIKRKVNKDDMVIFHISSHGELSSDNELFIRTFDTDSGVAFLSATALPTSWISQTIKAFDCTVVQFFDACHSGGASSEVAYKGVPNDIVVRELKEALEAKAIYFFASSSSTELSQERKEWRNGAFTEAILGCFSQKVFVDFNQRDIIADRDKDGYINVNEMSNYVSKVVRVLTKGAQRPKATFENSEPINIFVLE